MRGMRGTGTGLVLFLSVLVSPASIAGVVDRAGVPTVGAEVDLYLASDYGTAAAPVATTTTDGYEVELAAERSDTGEVTAELTVRRDGQPVTDLEPYLGAKGHLVAMRTGDLAYAHVHPVDGDDEAPGAVTFDAELSSAGRYGLFFDFNKATLQPESKPTLDEIARFLSANPGLKVHVVGHTDNVGGVEFNQRLSQARADAVVAALARGYGVPPSRMRPAGVGLLSPVASNADEEGRAKNRRVELLPQ